MKRTRTLRNFSLFHKIVAVVLAATIPLATLPEAALALPHGGVVSKGQASLGYSTGKLLVTQTTTSATFKWSSFNIKYGQSVVYKTPGSSSVSMNYIGGTTPSSINGTVTSNGILYFMNPNGLIFGSGSVVSAAGVMAFGSATPWGTPTGFVTNAGTLTATTGGTVALVGSSVTNSGTLTAPGGEVLLAAGSTVTPIAQANGASVSVATTGGGTIDDSGIVSAETVVGKTGTILLQSGMASGTTTLESTAVLDASAPTGGNGGAITVNGYKVVLNEIAPLNVSAPAGTPGTITIDPTVTDVGTPSALETIDSSQSTYLNNSNVCIALTANINLSGASWTPLGTSSSPFTGTFNGNGYTVSGYTIGTSSSSPYGGNDVGFIGYLGSTGVVKNLGVEGTIYASGCDVGGVVGYNAGTVEDSYNTGGVSVSVSGSVSGNNVGGVVGFNTGTVETSYNTGSVSVSSSVSSSHSGCDVGGIVGENNGGTVETSYNTGGISVSGSVSGNNVGGVVGFNNSGTVTTSYNTMSVSGIGSDVGGVVGETYGTSATAGIVEYSYNTGSVTGHVSDVGGVVGFSNSGTLEDSYNTGSVGVSGSGSDVGGVVGETYQGQVTTSYNTGSVSGSGSDVGGVVGFNNSGTVSDNYFLTSSSTYAIGSSTSSSGTNGTNVALSSFSTTTPTTTFANWSSLFNTWSSGAFQPSATSAPWFEGLVVSGSGTMTAPMLVPDLATYNVAGNSGTSVYNGSPVSPGASEFFTMGATSLPSGVSVTVTSGTTSSANAGPYTVTPSETISGTIPPPTSQTSLYLINSPVQGTWSITPAALTAATSGSKVYDGSESLGLTSSNTTFTGVDGQTAALNTSLTGTLSSPNVGSSLGGTLTVTGSDLTGSSGFSASNYTLPTSFTGGSITPATLTVTNTTASGRTYNGMDTAALSGATLSGSLYNIDGNSVVLANDTTGTLSNSGNAGTDSVNTDMTLSGTGAGNFSLTQPTVSPVLISKANLTLSGSEVYNGTTTLPGSALTATGVDGQTFSVGGTGSGDLSSPNVQTNAALANVTNLTLGSSGNGGSASNYNVLSTSGSSVTITKAPLTVTANSVSMTYGGTVPTLSGLVTGFVNAQTLSGDEGSATWSTLATSSSNAGQYGITGNVTLGSPYSGDYTITQAPGNSTALTIMAATSRTGGSSSGSGSQGGITSTNFTPVAQTVSLSVNSGSAMILSSGQLTSGSMGSSSSGSNSTDNGISSTGNVGSSASENGSPTSQSGGSSASGNGSPTSQSGGSSSSGTSLTISSSGVATLTVILPANEDATGTGIISYEEVKK